MQFWTFEFIVKISIAIATLIAIENIAVIVLIVDSKEMLFFNLALSNNFHESIA
jgi:hypothetical protein